MIYVILVKNKDPNLVASSFTNRICMSNYHKTTTRREIILKLLMYQAPKWSDTL